MTETAQDAPQAVPSEPSTTVDRVRSELNRLHDKEGLTWAQIASLPRYEGIAKGTLWNIANGLNPKDNELRSKLGLSTICPRCHYEFG